RNGQGGELRFSVENTGAARSQVEQNSVIAGWKELGIQVEQIILPNNLVRTEEERSIIPGFNIQGGNWEELLDARVSCRQIPAPNNGWRGRNNQGWCDQTAQGYIDRLQVTIAPDQRLQMTRELIQITMTALPNMPIY